MKGRIKIKSVARAFGFKRFPRNEDEFIDYVRLITKFDETTKEDYMDRIRKRKKLRSKR